MNPFNLNDFVLLSELPPADLVGFAARCARLAVRLLNQISFPAAPPNLEELKRAVRLAEGAAAGGVDLPELELAMRATGGMAYAALTQSRFRSDTIIGHVAHAAFAAVRTALSRSPIHAKDARECAYEAARAAGAMDIQNSLDEELRRIRHNSVLSRRSAGRPILS